MIWLKSSKTGAVFHGRYRLADGSYDPSAVAAINQVFGARYDEPDAAVSLRLVEFLDLLQDRLKPGARILIVSGYRSPRYNQKLRDKGGIVAKASLHQYGMAADIIMEGVPARTLWNYVKDLKYGGAGYYHDATVHLDVGRARFWDETTSKVGTGISDHNKRIGLEPEYDRYRPGEVMSLRFIQMTAFPVGVAPNWTLQRLPAEELSPIDVSEVQPDPLSEAAAGCRNFSSIAEMTGIGWQVPRDLDTGSYRLCAPFCDRSWEDMPARVCSPAFEVVAGARP